MHLFNGYFIGAWKRETQVPTHPMCGRDFQWEKSGWRRRKIAMGVKVVCQNLNNWIAWENNGWNVGTKGNCSCATKLQRNATHITFWNEKYDSMLKWKNSKNLQGSGSRCIETSHPMGVESLQTKYPLPLALKLLCSTNTSISSQKINVFHNGQKISSVKNVLNA